MFCVGIQSIEMGTAVFLELGYSNVLVRSPWAIVRVVIRCKYGDICEQAGVELITRP